LDQNDNVSATFGVALVNQVAGSRRRMLQAGGDDILGGIDATAMEWDMGPGGPLSPHPTDTADLASSLGIGGNTTNQQGAVTHGVSNAVQANRTSTSST